MQNKFEYKDKILFINSNKTIKSIKELINDYEVIKIPIDKLYSIELSLLLDNQFKAIFIDRIDVNIINLLNNLQKKSEYRIHLFIIDNDLITLDISYDNLIKIKGTSTLIINDENIFAITKEKSIIPLEYNMLNAFIKEHIEDEYFFTEIASSVFINENYINKFKELLNTYVNSFKDVNNLIFGTIALRTNFGFITTTRGKKDLLNISCIFNVDFETKKILANEKGSLNAPLLFKIFNDNKNVEYIIHSHDINEKYESLEYHMPGTMNDSNRNISKSFNIKYHGSFDLYDKNNKIII